MDTTTFQEAFDRERDQATRSLATRVALKSPAGTEVGLVERFLGASSSTKRLTVQAAVDTGSVNAWCESEACWLVLTETGDELLDVDRVVFGTQEDALEVVLDLVDELDDIEP